MAAIAGLDKHSSLKPMPAIPMQVIGFFSILTEIHKFR